MKTMLTALLTNFAGWLDMALLGLAALLAMPLLVLALQVLLAPRRASAGTSFPASTPESGRLHDTGQRHARGFVILVPAHNEAAGIATTVRGLLAELSPQDRLLVVADNCNDDTAAQARQAGAQVIERQNLTHRGKSYALDHGVRHLATSGLAPNVLVIVDADCQVAPGSIRHIADSCLEDGRPAQALYLMQAPPVTGKGLKLRIAEFAWLVRNQVRPSGWHRLGLPCQLMGTGMAFPWPIIEHAQLATGSIVEDMLLGIQLAGQGLPPKFCPQAVVTSEFPASDQAQEAQRTRWEHGHLSLLLTVAPRLLIQGVLKLDARRAALAVDLLVPPLVSLALLLTLSLVLSGGVALSGAAKAFPALVALMIIFISSIFLAWHRHGRHILSSRDWLSLPTYVVAKLPMYGRFIAGKREKTWVRTERPESTTPPPSP